MNRYTIHINSDESEMGIQNLTVNVDAGTYGVIRDFLLGKIALTPGPLPTPEAPQEVSSSCSSE